MCVCKQWWWPGGQFSYLAGQVSDDLGDGVSISVNTDSGEDVGDGISVGGVVASEAEQKVCSDVAHLERNKKNWGKRNPKVAKNLTLRTKRL